MPAECPPELVDSIRILVGDLPDMVRLVDAGGQVLFRNDASLILPPGGLGHLCEEESGREKGSCPACRLEEVLAKGVFQRWHVAHTPRGCPDNCDYYEITLSPVRDRQGRVCAVVEILRDESVNLGLQHYLIGRTEKQDSELQRRSEEAQLLEHEAKTLSSQLGELRDTQTEFLYRDRLTSLGELAAAMAHEIHTPLGAILSSSDLLLRSIQRLRDGAETPDGGELARQSVDQLESMAASAELVGEGARRIHGVLRALQNFSRLDEAPQKSVDLHEGLESSLQLLQHRLGDRIRIIRNYGELPWVSCRPDALNQVFMNLLLNAVQAIPERGQIEVETTAVGEQVLIRVRDSGSGVPAELLERIWELGFSTKERQGGTGLGLALCRKIVEDHGGSIEVESPPGRGTTFTVSLPVAPPVGA